MTRIQHRQSTELFDIESLLPSQRALLDIQAPERNWSYLHKLNVAGKNALGELLQSEVNPMVFETIESPNSYNTRRLMNTMTVLADRLIKSDNPSSFSEFVTVTVQDSYKQNDEYNEYSTYDSVDGTSFTPQGFLHSTPADFRQKVVALEMRTPALPDAENELSLHLYSDNSTVTTPAWEVTDERQLSDMFPSPGRYTYDLHKAPERFANEAVAFSVVSAIARIIKQSNEADE